MLLDQILDDIPVEYRDRYEALHARAGVEVQALRPHLDEYLATLGQVAAVARGMDFSVAERLANALLNLVDAVGAAEEAPRRAVHAAVIYFVQEDDDEEITGVLGFDDDVQVVNAVARAVGRPDLVVALPRTEG
ncbi:MAG: hypothetical protein H6735_12640 [Alphaproteobacteria bacterium]|nr:hypothetical protein [Alphaproteobacteria bacterium]